MKSFRTLSALAAAALTMTLFPVKAEDNVIVIAGQPAMEEAGMSVPIQEIVNLPDAVMTVSGENLVTDFDFGTDERTLFLEDNNYVTGYSYYNMMTLTGQMKQLKTALAQLPNITTVVYRGTSESVPVAYIDDFNELLDRLNAFDHTLTLKYDFTKEGANYIAENKSAKLNFHVQINGYWGYDLAGDSIIDKVTGQPGGFRENQELNNTYADFFFVDMTEKYEGMYELNDTDLQNPVLYMNDTEAMVVDVDFRGGQHLADKITDIVGDRDLYIYITHAHGDHYNNLTYFDMDAVKGVYYGENERLEGNQILEPWNAAGKLIRYTDGMQFERAGKQFEVIEMDNHTPGGSQLIDITDRILLSGDTLGAQTFKGGTTVALSQLDNWIEEVDKSIEVLKLGTEERRVDYIIGGHTNHLNTWEFAVWVRQCLQEVKDKGYDAVTRNPIGQNTVVVRDGKVLSPEENLAEFLNGTPVPAISDAEVTHVASVNFRDDRPKTFEVTASGKDAMEAAGMKEAIQEIVNTQDAVMQITENGSDLYTELNVGSAEEPVVLDDNNYVTGYSYYNVMDLTAKVKQVKSVLAEYGNENTVIHCGEKVTTAAYINDLDELLDKLNAFDHTLSLKYDFAKAGSNYIAENGTAKLCFHVQINGYWGYDLAGDSIIDKVTGEPGGYIENQQLNNKYAEFFFVDMTEKFEGLYEFNDTDLQNPVLYMNDEEAFIVDVDFRGGENFVSKVKDIIGDRALYIYITHSHGDHFINLKDFDIDDVSGIYYGENEPVSGPGIEGSTMDEIWERWVDADKLIRYTDGMQFERAGKQFEVIEMDNHSPGGSQLLDITDRILLSGDTLGAQTFKGGTTVGLSQLDNWMEELDKSIEVLKLGTDDRRVDYIIGGHTAHLNTWEFEMWVRQCLQEVKDKGYEAVTRNPIGQNTVVVKDGRVLTPEENLAEFLDGTPVPAISDEEVTHVASVNFRDDRQPAGYTGFKDAEDNEVTMQSIDGALYWYENGVQQGVYGDEKNITDEIYGLERGREIYDPVTDAWYWLDADADGAVARDKEVWIPYIFQGEDPATEGKWVRYDKYGQMVKGWYANDNGVYYYDLLTGAMLKGTREINGKTYTFDTLTGIMR